MSMPADSSGVSSHGDISSSVALRGMPEMRTPASRDPSHPTVAIMSISHRPLVCSLRDEDGLDPARPKHCTHFRSTAATEAATSVSGTGARADGLGVCMDGPLDSPAGTDSCPPSSLSTTLSTTAASFTRAGRMESATKRRRQNKASPVSSSSSSVPPTD